MGVRRLHGTLVAGACSGWVKVEQHEGMQSKMPIDGDRFQR